MRDINFFGNSDYFFFSGNPYFLYKTSEKEKKFFSAYYNKYGKLPKDKYFDKETKEKLKNFFDAKEIIYANFDKKNIGKNETIFFFNEEKEEVNIFFGGKQSFEKKNEKYFFYKFNQENFNLTLNKILEKFPNLKEEIKISSNKKRINLKCDVPTFLKLYPIFKEGTDDIYMTEKMVELLKKRKQVKIKLFNNKLLPEVDSTFEISNKEKIELLEKITIQKSEINFIIGGSNGVGDELRRIVDFRLNFSLFTFPHQLMRLILAEQIYRWISINNNIKYHK